MIGLYNMNVLHVTCIVCVFFFFSKYGLQMLADLCMFAAVS